MTARSLLTQGYDTLFYAEVQTPFLDAVVLLAHAMGTTKEKLLASLPDEVPPEAESRFRGFLDLRCAGVPVSYIRRVKEFYGLDFYVDERVLVPRPDTEVLVEKVLQVIHADPRLQARPRRLHRLGVHRHRGEAHGAGPRGQRLRHLPRRPGSGRGERRAPARRDAALVPLGPPGVGARLV